MPAEDRPLDATPFTTAALPDTPHARPTDPGDRWRQAPPELLALDPRRRRYLRRIGPWLLWRSGPATHDHATYWVARGGRPRRAAHPAPAAGRIGRRSGPSGARPSRFRTWKEDLRDNG